MAARLIINADDFGNSGEINRAVLKAHVDGVLTSASLMVAGRAASDAAAIARDIPSLAVGLHLTLSDGASVLGREIIPDLIDARGEFDSNPARAALKYYFSRSARRQLIHEIEAQFAAFADTGLPLSHVDGHQHLHAHPAVLPVVIEMALRYGARGIRIPHDPLMPNLRLDRSHIGYKLAAAAGHAYFAGICRRLLANTSLAWC